MTIAIAVANQKGGQSKTTTTINLAARLAENGKKVLTMDNDPQGHCAIALGIRPEPCVFSYSRYELVQVDFSQATGKDRIAYTFETEVTQNTAKLVTILSKR